MADKPKLLDRIAIRVRELNYARSTKKTYCYWAKKFILYHHKKHQTGTIWLPKPFQKSFTLCH